MVLKKVLKMFLPCFLTFSLLVSSVSALGGPHVYERYEGSYETSIEGTADISAASGAVQSPEVQSPEVQSPEARAPVTPANAGNQNLRDILTYFPEMWDPVNERTMGAFSRTAAQTISQYVWIEVPQDSMSTDNDIPHYNRGQRDLIQIRVSRPRQADPDFPHSNLADLRDAKALVRVPVHLTTTPYVSDALSSLDWNQTIGHCWNETRFSPGMPAYNSTPWHPLVHYTTPDPRAGVPTNPVTSHWNYNDAGWQGLTMGTWPWGDADFTGHPLNIGTGFGQTATGFFKIPASRGARPVAMGRIADGASGTMNPTAEASVANKMLARGFARVEVTMPGSMPTWMPADRVDGPFNDGAGSTGDIARHLATVAAIAWLNGEARGYTDRAATEEVVAYWSNGDVVMTGSSYGGTVQYAALASGYTRSPSRINQPGPFGGEYTLNGLPRDGKGGLRLIFPVAGIADNYGYMRRNGTDIGGYVYNNLLEGLGRAHGVNFWYSTHMQPGTRDRDAVEHIFADLARNGQSWGYYNYNYWWDHASWVKDLRPAVEAGTGVLTLGGYDDQQVTITSYEKIHWAMKQLGGHHMQIMQWTGHSPGFNWGAGRTAEIAWSWLDHFVFGVDGKFQREFYAGHAASGDAVSVFDIEAVSHCLMTGAARFYTQWPPLPEDGYAGPEINPVMGVQNDGTPRRPLSNMRRFYLGQNPQETGGLLLTDPNSEALLTFKDCMRHRAISEPTGHRNPADPYFNANWGLIDGQVSAPSWIDTPVWSSEGWFTASMRATMLFPTSNPWRLATGATSQRGFPAHQNHLRMPVEADISELYQYDACSVCDIGTHRLAFISAPLTSDVTLAGVPTVTVEVASDTPIGNLSAMIVDLGAVPRGPTSTNNTAYNTIPGNAFLGPWSSRFDWNQASGHRFPSQIVSRSGTTIQNANPPTRPHILPNGDTVTRAPGQPGVSLIDTNITQHTGMFPPYTWQTTDVMPGGFYSYTFELETAHYMFRAGNRLAVVIYGTHDHMTRTYIPAELTLRLGEGSFVYLPLQTAPDVYDAENDLDVAEAFLSSHAAALALTPETLTQANADVISVARSAFDALGARAGLLLADEKAHLDRLNALLGASSENLSKVQAFLTAHKEILGHDIVSIGWYDNWRKGWHDVSAGPLGDYLLDQNYVYKLVDNEGVLRVVQANIIKLNNAVSDLGALSAGEQALLSAEGELLQLLLSHALAVEFNATFHDVLWMGAANGFYGQSGKGMVIRPHIDGTNFSFARSRAEAAIAALTALPGATRDILWNFRNAAGAPTSAVQDTHQLNPHTRLNDIVARATRASAEIHSVVNIQGVENVHNHQYGMYGQVGVAPNEMRVLMAPGGELAIPVPAEHTVFTRDNIRISSGATFKMFSDSAWTAEVNSITLAAPGTSAAVRIEVTGTSGTNRYTLNVTRQNEDAGLTSFAGQALSNFITGVPIAPLYDSVSRKAISTFKATSITVPHTTDALRGPNAFAIPGVSVSARTAATITGGGAWRLFAPAQARDGYPDILPFSREIVGSLYIPLPPGEAVPADIRVRSAAFSLTEGYRGVEYYRIMVTRAEAATVGAVAIDGVTGVAIEAKNVVISLIDRMFNLAAVSAGDNVSGWFTNLPAGLTATVTAITGTTATVRISGMPAVPFSAPMAITIPTGAFELPASPVTVTGNENAVFDITLPVTSIRIDAGVTETVARGKVYKFGLRLNEGATGKNVVWTVSDPSFAIIDNEANIYILNKTGTVRLIATDPVSGLSHSITLRIAS